MKRLLALFLAVIMVCTLLPVSALAADTSSLTIGGTKYTASASGSGWSWDASKKVLTLSGYNKGDAIAADGDLTVKLSGANTISLSKDAKFGISVGGKLTINKTTSSASDTLTITQKTAASPSNLIVTGGNDDANACVINGGTVTLKNEVVGSTGKGIAYRAEVNNDASLNVTAPYRGVASTLTTNTSGKVTVTVNGSKSGASAVGSLNAKGSGEVTLDAPTPAVTVSDGLKIASSAGRVVLNGYTKVASDPLANYSVAYNKKVQGVDNYYEGVYTTDPSGNPGYYLCDSNGNPLSSATYQSVSDQPLTIMDSKILDISGLVVGTRYNPTIAVINATRGGSGSYSFSLKSGSKLPAGLSIDSSTGKISGIPTTSAPAGSFVVVAKDSKGSTAEATINYGAVRDSKKFLYIDDLTQSVCEVTGNASGTGWSYDGASKTLTLTGYNAGPIKCDADLTIVLKGSNTVTLPGPSQEGISVNGKLTINKSTNTSADILTVKQETTTTSANLIVTGNAAGQSLTINGGTVNLQGATNANGTSGIANSVNVNNDARLLVSVGNVGVGGTLNANTSDTVQITVKGARDGSIAARSLNATGSGTVTLNANSKAVTVYDSLTIASSAGTVALNGITRVSKTPYSSFNIASNKTIQDNNAYYKGCLTSTENAGKGYYLTDSNGRVLASAAIVSKSNLPLTIMDSVMFDLPSSKVGTKLDRELYLSCATYGGAGGYTYSVKSGSALPAGLSIDAKTGKISGTYSKSCAAGSAVVVVKDSKGATAEVTISYGKVDIDKVGVPVVTAGNYASSGKPRMTWAAVDGAAKYEVYRSGYKNGNYTLALTTEGTSYIDSAANAGYTYFYKVRAIGYDGKAGSFSEIKSRTCDCASPAVTASNVAASGKIMLKWNAVSGAKSYTVHRAESIDGTYTRLGSTTGTSFTNTSAVAGKTYYYKVYALSSKTSDAHSSAVRVGPVVCKCAIPPVTMGNSASSGKITVKWTAVDGATKYEVLRSGYRNGTYTKVCSTTGTSFTDTKSYAGYTYYYMVRAVCGTNSAANSVYCSIRERTCDCARPNVKISLYKGDPRVTWDKVYNADSYTIYRATTSNGTYTKMYTTKYTSYTNTSAVSGKTYYYKVIANCSRSSSATSAYSNVVHIRAN